MIGKLIKAMRCQAVLRRAVLLSPVAALAGAAAPDNLSVFDTVSPPADEIRSLFWLILAITGIIFLLVEGALLYCIFRFRDPQASAGDTTEPPQIYGSKPIEVAWTVAPGIIVFVLFLVVARSILDIRKGEPPDGALRVTVIGHQWWWEYQYHDPNDPEKKLIVANELHVPTGRPIYFELKSADVIHSFWLPRLAGKTDVIPGHVNKTWFEIRPGQEGKYLGQCAEYCGNQHANMILVVFAETPEQFDAWARAQREPAVNDPSQAAGRDLFLKNSCMKCHRIRGTPANGSFAPDLTHLASRETLFSGMHKNDNDWLTRWVRDPQPIKPGCWMPNMQLNESEVASIVRYLESLK